MLTCLRCGNEFKGVGKMLCPYCEASQQQNIEKGKPKPKSEFKVSTLEYRVRNLISAFMNFISILLMLI